MAEGRYRVRCAAGPVPPELLAVDAVLAAPGVEILQAGSRATVAAVRAGGRELVLKRFRERALEGLLLGSCAARAWRAAGLLRAARFPAPEMVAVLERRRFGLPRASCTVAGRVQGVALDALWPARRGKARRQLTRGFADYLRALHGAGVYPQDVRAANVLVTSEDPPTFVLVDLDRVRAYRRLSWRRRRNNVVQVLRSVGRRAPASERVRFLRRYLGTPSRAELRRRAAEILAVGRAKDAEYARRRGEGAR